MSTEPLHRNTIPALPERRHFRGGLPAGAGLLCVLVVLWAVFQRPLLSPALPAGVSYAGPLMLYGQPQRAPDFSAGTDGGVELRADGSAQGLHVTRPVWGDLSNEQQRILAGLEALWPYISNAEKRRWLAVAREAGRLDGAQADQLIANIRVWGHLNESERHAVRQQLRHVDATQFGRLNAAWYAYNRLDAKERQALADAARARPAGAARAAPTARRNTLVRIPAATQIRPGLSNLPKIPLQPVRYQPRGGATPTAATPASQVAPVEVASPSTSPAPPTPAPPRVTYWHGIPITPPEPPPIYAN